MAENSKETKAFRGLQSTLAAGFDVVITHPWILLLPIALDLLYWLGPQLRSGEQIAALQRLFLETEATAEMGELVAGMAGHTNLLTALSVPYLGVPGLMAGFIMPETTPVVLREVQVEGSGTWVALFLSLSFVGLLLATFYYGTLAHAVRIESFRLAARQTAGTPVPQGWSAFVRRLPVYGMRTVAMVLTLMLIILMLYLPLLIVATLSAFLSPLLAQMVLFGGLVMILWFLFYVAFGLHGIVLGNRSVGTALRESMVLVRRQTLPALLLFTIILAVRNLLSWLWLRVDTGSWLTAVSITGFAFVNTGLMVATFIFYRDRLVLVRR